MAPEFLISAGELEKYGYCPLNWWLYRQGVSGSDDVLEEGDRKHKMLSERISEIKVEEDVAKESETIVLYFAMASTIISFLGLAIFQEFPRDFGRILAVISLIWLLSACFFLYKAESVTTEKDRPTSERIMLAFAMVATLLAIFAVSASSITDPVLGAVLEVVALTWLIAASFFLYRALKSLEAATRKRKEGGVGKGMIDYFDGATGSKDLISKKYGLVGRPDYVLVQGENYVPVEVKTGRTPKGPLFSHILQVAAYCLLIEEEYRRPPPFGILKYGKVEHEIEYDDELKSLMLRKLDEMRLAAKNGAVHRNHNRPGKCSNCSRRDGCPERLT